jgi:hypothetical protein
MSAFGGKADKIERARQVFISKSYRITLLWVFDPAATKCTLLVNAGEALLLQLKWSDGTKLHQRSGAASLCRNQAIAIHLSAAPH